MIDDHNEQLVLAVIRGDNAANRHAVPQLQQCSNPKNGRKL